MKNLLYALPLGLFCLFAPRLQAQQQGQFSGDLELNNNFFIRDTLIGASGTPQYDRQKSGTESWLTLNYSNWGFDIGMRFDLFNNSNILDPNDSYSALGLGRWHIRKSIDKLHIAAGYIYDQIGSGILFRAYEARPLAIDNALVGLRLQYDLHKNWKIRAFSGKQKKVEKQRNLFEIYDPLVIGGAIDGYISFGDSSNVFLAPGAGMLKRTLDDATMNTVVGNISTDSFEYRFVPQYNTYAFTLYNTLTAGDFTWYVEGAYKTQEAIPDPVRVGYFQNRAGWVGYTSLSYSRPGFGITLQAKRTDNFFMRVSPLMVRNRGQIAFLPPMQRQNTYRLTARYNSATQELGEWAFMGDVLINPTKKLGFVLNYAHITNSDGDLLFREAFLESTWKWNAKQKLILGLQYQQYNQEIYEVKPGAPMVNQFTPFMEFVQKFDKKRSLRVEAQYMFTRQDLGSWAFLQLEFNVAPHWSFTVADLLNTDPRKLGEVIEKPQPDGTLKKQTPIHYPTVSVFYTYKAYRAGLSFVKQPQGVVCTGGICRLEPAFSGVRFNLTARF
jgi:hypothetical protein